MADHLNEENPDDSLAIHQYYLEIINSLPGIIYWVGPDCTLRGCNNNFINLLDLKRLQDIGGNPYETMVKFTNWSEQRIEAFKLDDMEVLFSGEPRYAVEEQAVTDKDGEAVYYLSTRVPLFDKNRQVCGLVVSLSDITHWKKLQNQESQARDDSKTSVQETGPEEPNILMVEDNLVAQKVEKALLLDLNCHVDIAESGVKALDLFTPGKYDMVFMDISLEDTSGYVVAKKIRQMEKNTRYHVPIIALTTYQADIIKHDCHDYFMDGVLTKPLTSKQARQIIQQYVYHKDTAVDELRSTKEKGSRSS